jgi:hypothetical protein
MPRVLGRVLAAGAIRQPILSFDTLQQVGLQEERQRRFDPGLRDGLLDGLLD